MVLVEDVLYRSLTDRGVEDVGEYFCETKEWYLVSNVEVGGEGSDIDSELDRGGDMFRIDADGHGMTVRARDAVLLVFGDNEFYGWDIEFLTFSQDHSWYFLEGVSTADAGIRVTRNDCVWGIALDSGMSGVSSLASRFSIAFLPEGLVLPGNIGSIRGRWFGAGGTVFLQLLNLFVQDEDNLNQLFFGEILEGLSGDDRRHRRGSLCLVVSV
jgi:hypothetical protein